MQLKLKLNDWRTLWRCGILMCLFFTSNYVFGQNSPAFNASSITLDEYETAEVIQNINDFDVISLNINSIFQSLNNQGNICSFSLSIPGIANWDFQLTPTDIAGAWALDSLNTYILLSLPLEGITDVVPEEIILFELDSNNQIGKKQLLLKTSIPEIPSEQAYVYQAEVQSRLIILSQYELNLATNEKKLIKVYEYPY